MFVTVVYVGMISSHQHCKYNLQLHDYIQPGSLTQKYEAFRPLYFTWQDSSAGAMVGMIYRIAGKFDGVKFGEFTLTKFWRGKVWRMDRSSQK